MAVVLDTSALVQLERSIANASPPVGPADEGVVLPAVVWAEALIGVRSPFSLRARCLRLPAVLTRGTRGTTMPPNRRTT